MSISVVRTQISRQVRVEDITDGFFEGTIGDYTGLFLKGGGKAICVEDTPANIEHKAHFYGHLASFSKETSLFDVVRPVNVEITVKQD